MPAQRAGRLALEQRQLALGQRRGEQRPIVAALLMRPQPAIAGLGPDHLEAAGAGLARLEHAQPAAWRDDQPPLRSWPQQLHHRLRAIGHAQLQVLHRRSGRALPSHEAAEALAHLDHRGRRGGAGRGVARHIPEHRPFALAPERHR